jgi:hypothetical protein
VNWEECVESRGSVDSWENAGEMGNESASETRSH